MVIDLSVKFGVIAVIRHGSLSPKSLRKQCSIFHLNISIKKVYLYHILEHCLAFTHRKPPDAPIKRDHLASEHVDSCFVLDQLISGVWDGLSEKYADLTILRGATGWIYAKDLCIVA